MYQRNFKQTEMFCYTAISCFHNTLVISLLHILTVSWTLLDWNALIADSSKHTHPVSDVEKALLAGEIEHQQEPHSIPEEGRGQAAEPETQTVLKSTDMTMCIF